MTISPSRRLQDLGLTLPDPWGSSAVSPMPRPLGPGVAVYAEFVRVVGCRAIVSGHLPIADDGTVCGPFGRVGVEVSADQAYASARRAMLGIFASLVRQLGTLDRVRAWVRLGGLVSGGPGFRDYPAVINGASRLVYDIFGPDAGRHARIAIGVGGLPFDAPVEIEAEVELGDGRGEAAGQGRQGGRGAQGRGCANSIVCFASSPWSCSASSA